MPKTPKMQDRNRLSAFKARWQTSSPQALSQTTTSPSPSHHRRTKHVPKKDPNAEFRTALKLDIEEHDNDTIRGVKDDAAAAAIQFRNTLHNDLKKTHSQTLSSLTTLQDLSSQRLSNLHLLYTNISAPLAETICHSDSIPQGPLESHLQDLEVKIRECERGVGRYEEKLREAMREEEGLWEKLEGLGKEGGGDDEEGLVRGYEEEVEGIRERAGRRIVKIDEECRVAMNRESMKMMELIMAD